MLVEQPAPVQAPAEGENYDTIGQFYKAIKNGIEQLGESAFADSGARGEQRLTYYFGKQGGKPTLVTGVATALQAIESIVEQGEGAADPTHPLAPYQPYGAYNHYGERVDGTYGPILGTPLELSHYYKFKSIVDGHTHFPEVRPTVAAASIENYANPLAREMAEAFDSIYSVMLAYLEKAFQPGEAAKLAFFQLALPIMHEILPAMARAMMQIPIWTEGDATVGPNALPLWRYSEGSSLQDFNSRMKNILARTGGQYGLADALTSLPGAVDRLCACEGKLEVEV
jgi:hypothetical protein